MASSARLDELKKKFDENPRRYFAPLANEHRKSGDLDQAIALCRTHLPQQPGHISGHIVLAQALFEAGSLDESREIFHTALGLDPENLIALRYLGDIAKESADVETARSWYQRVLEVDPRNDEIVQLVRDLDAPPAPAAEPREEPAVDTAARFAPVEEPSTSEGTETEAVPETPAAPAPAVSADDARFAPLSLDEIDVSDLAPADSEPVASTPNEPELLDAAELDPFDLNPANGAESLYDPSAGASADDFFLTELSGANAPIDGSTPEPKHVEESWSAQESVEASAPPPPNATEPEFEEGSFYLEPPPPAPSEEPASQPTAALDATPESAEDATAGFDALAAEYYVPIEESRRHSRPSLKAIEAIPEPPAAEEVSQPLAELPTAEWQPPVPESAPAEASSSASDDLGLEVMEFVPPSSQSSAPSDFVPTADADPMMGHVAPLAPNEPTPTPAGFVTETMAELYLQQGFRTEALAVYRELLSRNPSDASLRDRIEQIESGSISSIGIASVSEDVVEAAIKRQSSRPARSVRSFFANFAGRRAPASPQPVYESYDAPVEHEAVQPEPAEQEVAPVETVSQSEPAAADERIQPLMSAAETLASFDPFANTMDLPPADALDVPPADSFMPETLPNATPAAPTTPEAIAPVSKPTPASMPAQPPASRPTPMSMAAHPSVATTPEPVEPTSSRRSLEQLFPDTQITARTEAAAQTLATAFGRTEPQGRPTRAASNELSLDHVFRGAPEGAPPADGGFSFDQFFSDSRASGGDSSPTATASETGRSGGDAHDIEQFTAWLEGLKKK